MKFTPKPKKFKRYHKGKVKEITYDERKAHLRRGKAGLRVIQNGRFSSRLLETIRRTLRQVTKRKVKIWMRCLADTPVTKKPREVRMGKGKGSVNRWVSKVPAGKVVAELINVDPRRAQICFNRVAPKIPVKLQLLISKRFNAL